MAEAVVVDTDVLSFILKGDTRAAYYREYVNDRLIVISFQTVAELERAVLQGGWGSLRKRQLDSLIQTTTVEPSSWELARVWARLVVFAKIRGRVLHSGDAWVAATAIHRQAPLLSHKTARTSTTFPASN